MSELMSCKDDGRADRDCPAEAMKQSRRHWPMSDPTRPFAPSCLVLHAQDLRRSGPLDRKS